MLVVLCLPGGGAGERLAILSAGCSALHFESLLPLLAESGEAEVRSLSAADDRGALAGNRESRARSTETEDSAEAAERDEGA